jgi:hypothetical protein
MAFGLRVITGRVIVMGRSAVILGAASSGIGQATDKAVFRYALGEYYYY